jgi:hypothetical protein
LNKTAERLLRKELARLKKQLRDVRQKLIKHSAKIKKAVLLLISCASFQICLNPASAVQPMPGGVRIVWSSLTGDVSYAVWKLPPNSTNWLWLANQTNTSFIYTNPIPDGTMFGVSAIQRMTNGICCVSSDIGVAPWPPHVNTPANSVLLIPTNGYIVTTGRWVKVSSDLSTFEDWMRFRIAGTNVTVEHRASPLRPRMFISYPTSPPSPPLP